MPSEKIQYNDGMLDIETMGKNPGAPVLSIGLQMFDLGSRKLGKKFYVQISLESCMAAGLQPDASTILWWMKQSDEARKAFESNNGAYDLFNGLNYLRAFVDDSGSHRSRFMPWGNSSRFDCGILMAAYRAAGLHAPWEHWNERDYRTIKNMKPNIKLQRVGVHHNALDDAVSQTLHLFKLMDAIEGRHGPDYVANYVEDAVA